MPVPRRDLDATRQRLFTWLEALLPDVRDLSVSPLSGPDATGFSNDTLFFDLHYRTEDRTVTRALVCRVAPTGPGVFPRYDVALQYRVMDALAPTAVPVPAMVWLETDPAVLGAPFFVMERIEGRIPSDNPPYHVEGWLTESAPAERTALWWSAVDTLAAIHRCDPAALGIDFLEAPAAGEDAVAWQLDSWRRYADWVAEQAGPESSRGPEPVTERAWQRLAAERPPDSGRARLCWGDARIGNMIFRGGRCVGVLDWEMATLGPPEMDLGWFLYMDRHHSEGVGGPRLPGFPERRETVARWEQCLGRRAVDLPFWELFAGWRFAVILRRVGQQMRQFGILPADSRFDVDNTATRLLAGLLDSAG